MQYGLVHLAMRHGIAPRKNRVPADAVPEKQHRRILSQKRFDTGWLPLLIFFLGGEHWFTLDRSVYRVFVVCLYWFEQVRR